MAALGWLLNMGFAAGAGTDVPVGGAAPLEGVSDGQSVSIPDSVRDNRFRVGIQGVSLRREQS